MFLWQKLIKLELINSRYKLQLPDVTNPSQTYNVDVTTTHSGLYSDVSRRTVNSSTSTNITSFKLCGKSRMYSLELLVVSCS